MILIGCVTIEHECNWLVYPHIRRLMILMRFISVGDHLPKNKRENID